MRAILEGLKIPENRFLGTLLLLGGYTVPGVILILWWKEMSREEKVKMMSIFLSWVLLYVLNIIPIIGQIAAIVMLVFIIIGIVKFYQGDVDYKIIGAYQLADAIVKK